MSGDRGQPCLTPARSGKVGPLALLSCMLQCDWLYSASNRWSALGGSPMCCNILRMKSWETEGKADAKSIRRKALLSCIKGVCIDAMSISRRLRIMDLLWRKPCCLASTQFSRWCSQQHLVALAMSLLSVLTILSGLVLAGE